MFKLSAKVLLLLALPHLCCVGAEADKAPVIEFSMHEHDIRIMADGSSVMGTCEYGPTTTEKAFYDRLTEAGRITFQSKPGDTEPSMFVMKNHVGEFVSWFGIVRRIEQDPSRRGGTLLVENKYFDRYTHCEIQEVEIGGAGDFKVELNRIPADLIPLVLVRVYGQVVSESGGLPVIKPEYIRVWHWGQFNFDDLFGEDRGNPEWKKRMKLPPGENISRASHQEYYNEMLGPTEEELQQIEAWHNGRTKIDASDDPYQPKQGSAPYTASYREQQFFDKLSEENRVTVQSKLWKTEHAKFRLRGHVQQFVSWFGIVREAAPYIYKAGGTMLVENKYFKGSGDQHLQTVSLRGGGDFKVELTHYSKDIEPLILVRVYGTVIREESGIPVVQAAFVRLWDLSQYNFEDYGIDKSNSRWSKSVTLNKNEPVYAAEVSADYYIKRLGLIGEQAKMVQGQFQRMKESENAKAELDKVPLSTIPVETPSNSPLPDKRP